jgi:hypothetical protein
VSRQQEGHGPHYLAELVLKVAHAVREAVGVLVELAGELVDLMHTSESLLVIPDAQHTVLQHSAKLWDHGNVTGRGALRAWTISALAYAREEKRGQSQLLVFLGVEEESVQDGVPVGRRLDVYRLAVVLRDDLKQC